MIRTQYRAIGAFVATALLNLGGLAIGWWWVTVLTALVAAALVRGGVVLAAVLGGTLLAWGAALLWQSGDRTIDVANLVGAMVFNGRGLGWVVLVITFAYAVLLTLVGAWLGAAARRSMVGIRASRAAESEQTKPEQTKPEQPGEPVLMEQEALLEEEERV